MPRCVECRWHHPIIASYNPTEPLAGGRRGLGGAAHGNEGPIPLCFVL
jgi:hypothetical protein